MGEGVEDFGVGGSNPPHFREFFKGSGTSKTPVHSIIMGDITSDLDEPGWFPPQGGPLVDKDAAEKDRGRYVD